MVFIQPVCPGLGLYRVAVGAALAHTDHTSQAIPGDHETAVVHNAAFTRPFMVPRSLAAETRLHTVALPAVTNE